MANQCYNVNASSNMLICNVDGDGSHNTFKFTLTSDLLYEIAGGAVPDKAFVQINQDSASQGLTATAAIATTLGVTTCTVTFNKNLAASDPNNGPYVIIQITFEYASQ